jgi:hypothetical protein
MQHIVCLIQITARGNIDVTLWMWLFNFKWTSLKIKTNFRWVNLFKFYIDLNNVEKTPKMKRDKSSSETFLQLTNIANNFKIDWRKLSPFPIHFKLLQNLVYQFREFGYQVVCYSWMPTITKRQILKYRRSSLYKYIKWSQKRKTYRWTTAPWHYKAATIVDMHLATWLEAIRFGTAVFLDF